MLSPLLGRAAAAAPLQMGLLFGRRPLTVVAARALLLLLAATFAGCKREVAAGASAAPIVVAAAADLTDAFGELGRVFEQETGRKVTFSFGSTGLLAKQLSEGAPYDVFAAANTSFVDDVVAAGACDGASKAPYGRGRLVVWTRQGGVVAPRTLEELTSPRFQRIAIANPEHAPYGKAAREALQHAGLWASLAPRLVLGENVRQTLQFAESGNADAAIIALALVAGDTDNPRLAIDETWHRPIEQTLVVCTRGQNRVGGGAFAAFVNSAAGRALMRQYGFLLPGETALP
jgi:molybdate transport system substrate-binding protein